MLCTNRQYSDRVVSHIDISHCGFQRNAGHQSNNALVLLRKAYCLSWGSTCGLARLLMLSITSSSHPPSLNNSPSLNHQFSQFSHYIEILFNLHFQLSKINQFQYTTMAAATTKTAPPKATKTGAGVRKGRGPKGGKARTAMVKMQAFCKFCTICREKSRLFTRLLSFASHIWHPS